MIGAAIVRVAEYKTEATNAGDRLKIEPRPPANQLEFCGMDASDAKRLRELKSENPKLRILLAKAHVDIHALKSILGVKR